MDQESILAGSRPPPTGDATSLIGPDDPPVFTVVNGESRVPLLLVCDHASRAFPKAMGSLGLDEDALNRHIAYDIGAADVTLMLAERLGVTAVLCGYSRLMIDCNRAPGDPHSILEVSDGIVVPGNVGLTSAQQEARAEDIHWPYHHAVEQNLARLRRSGPEPALFSIHSFTPTLNGEDRYWDIGVLWNRDPRLAVPLIKILREHDHLHVGDNQPYSGREIAYTIDLHAGAAGLANCAVEIRQDHCDTQDEAARWAVLLGDALARILQTTDSLHRVAYF